MTPNHHDEQTHARERAGKLAIFICGHTIATDQLARRALTEAIANALPSTWERKAEAYEWARPSNTELLAASPTQGDRLRTKHAELSQLAETCRMHADYLRTHPPQWLDELADALPKEPNQGAWAA